LLRSCLLTQDRTGNCGLPVARLRVCPENGRGSGRSDAGRRGGRGRPTASHAGEAGEAGAVQAERTPRPAAEPTGALPGAVDEGTDGRGQLALLVGRLGAVELAGLDGGVDAGRGPGDEVVDDLLRVDVLGPGQRR